MPKSPRIILICQHCEESLCVKRGDLPDQCPICRERGYWRVAVEGEFTASDLRLIRKHHDEVARKS